MKSYFTRVFSEILEKIKNDGIKKQVVDVWVLGAEEGDWKNPKEIEKIPFTLLVDNKGINLIEHTIAVTKGAEGLANAMFESFDASFLDLNWDVLYAGGLLHDVGKLLEIQFVKGKYKQSYIGKCTRHPISGAILAARIGCNYDILNTIANHAKEGEGNPQRIETILIHQADFALFNTLTMLEKGMLLT